MYFHHLYAFYTEQETSRRILSYLLIIFFCLCIIYYNSSRDHRDYTEAQVVLKIFFEDLCAIKGYYLFFFSFFKGTCVSLKTSRVKSTHHKVSVTPIICLRRCSIIARKVQNLVAFCSIRYSTREVGFALTIINNGFFKY